MVDPGVRYDDLVGKLREAAHEQHRLGKISTEVFAGSDPQGETARLEGGANDRRGEQSGWPGDGNIAGGQPEHSNPQGSVTEKVAQGAAYGSTNKIVTSEAADTARALLKSKLHQLNAGLDPEMAAAV